MRLAKGIRQKICKGIKPGTYKNNDKKLWFTGKGIGINNVTGKDEFVLTCGILNNEYTVEEGAPICKIETTNGVLDPKNNKELKHNYSCLVQEVYESFGLDVEKIGVGNDTA